MYELWGEGLRLESVAFVIILDFILVNVSIKEADLGSTVKLCSEVLYDVTANMKKRPLWEGHCVKEITIYILDWKWPIDDPYFYDKRE